MGAGGRKGTYRVEIGGPIPHPPSIISRPLTVPAQIQYLSPDSHLDPRLLLLQVIGRASLGWGGGRRGYGET